MALQDLTPQLRTRLSRMERAVGWFVLLATLLLLFGFGYYVYTTAENKGWFKAKATYYTYADTAAGLTAGDPVTLLGHKVGQIIEINTMPARGEGSDHNIYIGFYIEEPYFGYVWTEGSVAKVQQAGFLDKRQVEITRGTNGHTIYLTFTFHAKVPLNQVESLPNPDKLHLGQDVFVGSNLVVKAWSPLTKDLLDKLAGLNLTNGIAVIDNSTKSKKLTAVWNPYSHSYEAFGKKSKYELPKDETPALTDRAQALVSQVEAALPNFLRITNQLYEVLSNSARLTENLNVVAENARPMITNLTVITDNLRNPKGSLGEWIIPTNLDNQLDVTLLNVNGTLTNVNTNLVTTIDNINRSLNNLADITSNLNQQVQANSNILTQISDIVVHSDQFVQGLKRFWLFRHLFKHENTNAPPATPQK